VREDIAENRTDYRTDFMDRTEFLIALRKALMQLDDYKELRKNPLMQLLPFEQQESPAALQRFLLERIEALRESQDASAQRHYEILYHRYVEQLSQTDLAFQIGLSIRHLRREQNNAIEYLADHIKSLFPWAYSAQNAQNEFFLSTMHDQNRLQNEIEWLHKSFHTEATHVYTELQKVLEDASILAAHHDVKLDVIAHDDALQVSIPPVIFRQVLLTLLTTIIPSMSGRYLQIVVSEQRHFIEIVMLCPASTNTVDLTPEVEAAVTMASDLLTPFNSTIIQLYEPPANKRIVFRIPILVRTPVLLIDDNPDTRQLFQRYVNGTNYFLIAIDDDANNVVDLAVQNRVKAAIVDIMMPEVEGWDILARLLYHPATQQIPVAICSILPQRELSKLLGASLFLQKPVARDTFIAALDSLTGAGKTLH
jgi:CheY-like chemotaxis protein